MLRPLLPIAAAVVALAGAAGLGQAETISDFGSMSSSGAYNACVRDGGIVVSSMPGADNQYHSCYPPGGGMIWCEGDFSACYRFEPVPEPPPNWHTAPGGMPGTAVPLGTAPQLRIQR
jgi:hypothetical protein